MTTVFSISGKLIAVRALHAILLAAFLIICNHASIAADFAKKDWQSIAVRVGLSLVFALVVVFRLKEFLSWKTSRMRADSLLILLFLGILSYPLFSQFSFLQKSLRYASHKIMLNSEKKGINPFLNGVANFPAMLENYRKRHFRTPREYINIDSLIKIYALRVSPTSKVAMGKNGFFYEGFGSRRVERGIVEKFDNISDYLGQIPFSEAELRQWKRALEERRFWLKQQGSEFVFVLAPTKAFVYPEYLPDKLNSQKGVTRYEQLSRYLRNETDIHFIDLLPPLLAAKKHYSYPYLFYKSDFHWNFFGSFIAYREIIRKMNEFFPDKELEPLPLDAFEMDIDTQWYHKRFIRLLGLPAYLHPDEDYITMVPAAGNILNSVAAVPSEGIHDVRIKKEKIYDSNGRSMDIRLILNPLAGEKSILLLGDSFLEKCELYLSAHFQRLLSYRTIVNFPRQIFHFEHPEIVLQEVLNMFILRPPPENPPEVKQAYLKYRFSISNNTVSYSRSFDKGGEASGQSRDRSQLQIPPSAQRGERDITICRLIVDSDNDSDLLVMGRQDSSPQEIKLLKKKVDPKEKEVFFEIPDGRIDTLLFSAETAGSSMPRIKHIEIKIVSG